MRFEFEATGIGSVPFKDKNTAVSVILENFRSIPFWPQLPKRSYLENMYAQFAERIPGFTISEKNKTMYMNTARAASEMEEVYVKCENGDTGFFKISEDRAEGLYAFLESLDVKKVKPKFIKGHITGPISFGLSLTDENKKSVIHDRDLFEILTKVLCMKARWQIRELKKLFGNVIIFIDEPYLVSIGSSYINIDMVSALQRLDEVVDSIKAEGALVGIHCCGNTDWPILLKRGIDILSFDAYNFIKEFSLYAEDIKNFTDKGKTIAWGIVPSSEAALKEDSKSLLTRAKECLKILEDKGVKSGAVSSLITPSCGTGTLTEDNAKKIFSLTSDIERRVNKYG